MQLVKAMACSAGSPYGCRVQDLATPLPIQLPANGPEKAAEDSPSALAPVPTWVQGSWLQTGSAAAMAAMWGMNQQM